MEFLDLAARRFSTLHYTGEPISQEVLEQVLRAGQLAPPPAISSPSGSGYSLNRKRGKRSRR